MPGPSDRVEADCGRCDSEAPVGTEEPVDLEGSTRDVAGEDQLLRAGMSLQDSLGEMKCQAVMREGKGGEGNEGSKEGEGREGERRGKGREGD